MCIRDSVLSTVLGSFGQHPKSQFWEVEKRITWLLVVSSLGCASRAAALRFGDPDIDTCYNVPKMVEVPLQMSAFVALSLIVAILESRQWQHTALMCWVLRFVQLLMLVRLSSRTCTFTDSRQAGYRAEAAGMQWQVMDGFLELHHQLRVSRFGFANPAARTRSRGHPCE